MVNNPKVASTMSGSDSKSNILSQFTVESKQKRPGSYHIMSASYLSDVGDADAVLGREVRKGWPVSGHCSTTFFPATYPDIVFSTSSCCYYYLQHTTSGVPDRELVKMVKQAYLHVLSKLNRSQLKVKNFILPVQLMLLKHIDPYSRQRIVEQMCKYLSLQHRLRSVVFEQAALSLVDLCRLLLALSTSGVRKLYLWNALDKCQLPFKGPLQSNIDLDNLPRIPYILNPGGRKYLKKLKQQRASEALQEKPIKHEIKSMEHVSNARITFRESEMFFRDLFENDVDNIQKTAYRENSVSASENYDTLLKLMSFSDFPDLEDHIISNLDVAIQCDMTRASNYSNTLTPTQCSYGRYSKAMSSTQMLTKMKTDFCNEYLKKYENCEIDIDIVRDIFKLALNQLVNLTTLSVNYGMLADGTGEALAAVTGGGAGGGPRGRQLRQLELLCQLHELPVAAHSQYDRDADHAIPDAAWTRVKADCPLLKVRFVCVNMMTNDTTKKFLTRSIPLNSLHVDCGFCPTLVTPQIAFFSTLKCLQLHYKETIEHLSVVLWHTSGRIDSSLDKFMREASRLRTFQYYGPVQYTSTVRHMCETALSCSRLERFTLMVQGDPCYPEVARDVVADVQRQLRQRFLDRGIHFRLGTHNS